METDSEKPGMTGNSLAVQWLGLHPFTAEDLGSLPGQGTKIQELQADLLGACACACVCVCVMTELANSKYAQGFKGKCENNERNRSYETFTRWA